MASTMAKPSVSIPDELLEDFDDEIMRRKLNDELPRKATRSDVVRLLMEAWLQGNVRWPSTSRTSTATATTAD